MRPILILGVLFFTLLTFYSALWYKSEEIETDITTRVTNDLDTAQAKDVEVDVDGRHVTLSGVVYDADTERTYLDTANQTYGALGPIDGLTLQQGVGFLNAVKSDTGITLTGAVPSDVARDALLAAAAEGTNGEVIDAMSVGAAAGAWTDEAGFGLSQMAALSSGALSVTPDNYTLSGSTSGDATTVRAAVADRSGWSTFVSAPTVETGLTQELGTLNANLGTLTAERDTLAQQVTDLTGERDEFSATLGTLTAERDGLNGTVADLTAARNGLQATIGTLTGERDTALSDLSALRASLDDTQTSTANLAGELDGSKVALAIATAQLVEKDAVIEDLTGQISILTADVATLTDELETQKASMSSDQQAGAELTAKIATLEGDLTDATAKAATLEGDLADAATKTATLESNLNDVTAGRDAAQVQVQTLTQTVQERGAQVADLTGQLANQANADATTSEQVAALTGQVDTLAAQNGELTGQINDLSAVVAARDTMIKELKAATPVATSANAATTADTAQIAAQCGARAGDVLQNAQINFSSGTANLRANSVATLERLTGIALACSNSGLSVEVGGHTDSQGSDENNQVLSEMRAKAIAQFMIDRGVPADTLKPVGYGEEQPIGDNETREGRQQNRRISFEWQAR